MSSKRLHWTTFSHIRATQPVPLDMTLETLLEILTTPREVDSKKDMQDPFSLVRYKDNSKRGTEGIESVTGVVLDFDFKEDIQNDKQGEEFIKTYLVERGLSHFHHVWYTTFSFTPKRPNFRLVIPFNPEQELCPSEAAEGIDKVFYWLKDYAYLDKCSKTLAQVYYPPVIRKDKGEAFFFCGGNIKGRYFDPDILDPRPREKELSIKEFVPAINYQTSSALYFEKALEHIPADITHDEWIKAGMCLKSELGEAGFVLWDHWSQGGSKYAKNKKGEMQRVWSGFKKEGVSGGTLIQMAKEYGFKPVEHRVLNPAVRSNVVSFPHGQALQAQESFEDISARILEEEEIEDEHAVLKDWNGLEKGNIYDVSAWPFLDFLNTVFLEFCHPERHSQRLASVITVAGHILKQNFNCPSNINFYTLAMMPTGTGKNKFLETIDTVLAFFLCSSHIICDIGTVQGLEKHLRLTGGKMFNKVDEASELIRNMHFRGNPNKNEIPKVIKEIFTNNKYTPRAIKGEETKTIENIYASAFWTGTDYCFKFLEEDDFWSGMMGRFLFFHMGNFSDFGITDPNIQNIIERKPTTEEIVSYLPAPFDYQFGAKVILCQEATELSNKFLGVCQEKAIKLGETDLRRTILVRAQEFARKLAILTCTEKGEVTLEGMQWGVRVVIASIQVASALIQKRFHSSRSKEALERVEACIIRECQKAQSYCIPRRLIFRSLSDLSNRFLEDLIDRLIKNETVREEEITNRPGSNSVVLTVIGRSLQKKIGDLKGQPSEEDKLNRIRSLLSKFWQKSQGEAITAREMHQSLRPLLSHKELQVHLQKLETQGFLTLETFVRKNGYTTTFIKQPLKEQKGEVSDDES